MKCKDQRKESSRRREWAMPVRIRRKVSVSADPSFSSYLGFSLPFYACCHNPYLTCSTHIYLIPEIFFVLLAPSLCPTQFILNLAARIICPEWFHHVTWQSRSSDGSLLQLSPLVPHKHLLESWYTSDTSPGTAYTLMHNKDQVLLSQV